MEIRLSIIIPVYNCGNYTEELLAVLDPQIRDDVEVIIVDDGSKTPFTTKYNWANVYRKTNGGASSARNYGLEISRGEYIAWIDGDDLVAHNYISTILDKIETEHFDYCYLSWKAFDGWNCLVQLKTIDDKFPPFNLCVWNRVMRRDMIGDVRFNINKPIAEDAEFIRDVKEEGKKKSFISQFLYYYRSSTPNSLTKRFGKGELDMRRVVYHFNKITSDMDYLIDEVKELDKVAQVVILTNENNIPELENYAMILKPCPMQGTEFRGEPTQFFTKIDLPIKTQIVIYTAVTFALGGIETFIYNFCMNMKDYYDILVLYEKMDISQIKRLEKHVHVMKNNTSKKILCDTLIVNRITDNNPPNVTFNQKIQMVHSCKLQSNYVIPKDNQYVIPVSEAAYKTFNVNLDNCNVINNLTYNPKPNRILRLISATRLTFEKGEDRMIKLAKALKENGVPFMWFMFTEQKLKETIDGIIYMKPTLNIRDYIADADYLVQLSDSEGFCYSIVEALELGVPVLTTPITVLDEIGFEDNKHGYVLPFNVSLTKDFVEKIYTKIPKIKYKYDNESRIQQWRNILGNTTPKHDYVYNGEERVVIRCLVRYYSLELKREVAVGEELTTTLERAQTLENMGVVKIQDS